MMYTVKKYVQMVHAAGSVTTVYGTLWGGGLLKSVLSVRFHKSCHF